jgi:hypothetical protein
MTFSGKGSATAVARTAGTVFLRVTETNFIASWIMQLVNPHYGVAAQSNQRSRPVTPESLPVRLWLPLFVSVSSYLVGGLPDDLPCLVYVAGLGVITLP